MKHRYPESIGHVLNTIDYACLAPELREPPPEVCAKAFQNYLPALNKISQ
jgi:hypothetical protein